MKSIFTFLLATVSVSAFAYDGGKLTITVPSSKNIQVYVDGRAYAENNNNTIVLNNIQPGNHSITIYRNKKNGNDNYGKNNRNKRSDQRNVVYNSKVYVRSAYHVDVMINRFGKAMIDERAISNNRYGSDDDWYDDSYDGNYGNDGGRNRYDEAMNDREFEQVVQRIRNQWIGKLATAKDALNTDHFNTYQVRQILQLFSPESDKLQLAKLSYQNIVDKENFHQLYDLFSYQSQRELDQYTRDSRY